MSVLINDQAIEAMKSLLGDQFESTLKFCLSEFKRLETEIINALDQDRETATRNAHSLKSNAAQFGAKSLSSLARELEQALIIQDQKVIKSCISRLSAEVSQTQDALILWYEASSSQTHQF